MKNCEYYQQMISSIHDDGADINSVEELKIHVTDCSGCTEFYQILLKQSTQLQKLPTIDFEVEEKTNQNIFRKIWQTKISIPLPAAAAVLVFLIGSFWLTGNHNQAEPQIIEVEQKQTDYQNVQFVKFSPQPAVLVKSIE